ncbi:MAG: ATP--guanido phosphotransferase [Clostridia bacterium]|nr:ATP--guanido phosphotransferase [Clostridia bacterium]
MERNPEIQSVITSTRIRLARNLAAYPFPQKLTPKLGEEVVYLVEKALEKLDAFQKNAIGSLSEEEAVLLQEQHLISPAFLKCKKMGAAFISKDRTISIMVNEEDHLREQYIYKGFDLYKAYERVSGIDEGLATSLAFAYDDRYGYLTACPSNLGTGMRASVMMFLPGLFWSKELGKFIPELKKLGLTVRGVFGEGTVAEGYSYQVSNERTLGVSEKQILDSVHQMVLELCELELRARERMLKEQGTTIKDKCLRAYGTLCHCAQLPLDELTSGMVKIKLGIALGFFKVRDMRDFNDFLADMRPASFRLENDLQKASEEECAMHRAEIVGRVLPELVVRVR